MNERSGASAVVRSSAAEHLTFVAAAGQVGLETLCADENVWRTQKRMGRLYQSDFARRRLERKAAMSGAAQDAALQPKKGGRDAA